jgi:hypothetical protein
MAPGLGITHFEACGERLISGLSRAILPRQAKFGCLNSNFKTQTDSKILARSCMNSADAQLILSRLRGAVRSFLFCRGVIFKCRGDSLIGHFGILLRGLPQCFYNHCSPHQILF